LKITDFGFAQQLKPTELLHNACGTPMYVAPDMLRRDNSGYGKEVDLWSAGVVLFIMVSGYPPFYDEDDSKLLSTVQSGEYEFLSPYWDDISHRCKDVIEKLLVVDPGLRLTAHQTESHCWLLETPPLLNLQSQSSVVSTEGTNTISRMLSNLRSRFVHSRTMSSA
jgi:serine/threonine protein kinase